MSQQNAMLDVMLGAAKEGAFTAQELPSLIDTWRKQYQA